MTATTVLAALDNSLADKPVLKTALALGDALGATVEPIHVATDGGRVAHGEAEAAGLPLSVLRGPVIETLLTQGARTDVVALVAGARGMPGARKPLGSTALAIATTLPKPVVIVPPNAMPAAAFRRVLVPLEGRLSETLTPRVIIDVARGSALEVVVLHVYDPTDLPAFTDQPQHEQDAWAEEFLRRYCPWGIGSVRLEVRVGRAEDLLPLVAEQTHADLVALGWGQRLAEGRAPVVRAVLARGRTPVLLVPVRAPAAPASSASDALATASSAG
jgi:nucleotide-binding universal stress UspA family protein